MKQARIIGAGLAGTLMGILLAQKGWEVEIYEKRGDMRKEAVQQGRSINLALSARGLHALKQAGAADTILKRAIPMKGRMIHDLNGRISFQPYSPHESDSLYSVSRQGLNMELLNFLERERNAKIFFHHKCLGLNLKNNEILFEQEEGVVKSVSARFVIAADGAHSAVRQELQKLDRFQYHQDYLEWGYKELTIPAGQNNSFLLEKNALHIWPRHNFMLIALPNQDGSFTCTLFLPFDEESSFSKLKTESDLVTFFKSQFQDALPLMPTLTQDFFQNPTGSLIYLSCFPWRYKDLVVLLGDACHAVVPFYGQGMNAAFEDCVVLDRCLQQANDDLQRALANYEQERKANTDALAKLSLQNFVEMRDKVVSRWFRIKKKTEHILEKLLPSQFISLYSMVSFSLIPYAQAVKKNRKQEMALKYGITGFILFAISVLFFFLK